MTSMDSIITGEKKCYVCGAVTNLHCHHIFMGANRKISEDNGFKVYLCGYHHNQSNDGVHGKDGHELDMWLKQEAQRRYEQTHSREDFIALIGRSFL